MIRVLIVDDHAMVREGLERLVDTWDGIGVIGSEADMAEAVAAYRALRPDVVLMDIVLSGEYDGIEATRRIVAGDPDATIVMLTSHPDHDHVERALSAGAVGYVLKHAPAADVERAIRAAARGESPVDSKVAHVLLRGRALEAPDRLLSPREQEILDLLGQGMPNKLIARRLAISERTVKGHLTRIYRQIGVTDRVQAALYVRGLEVGDPTSPRGGGAGGSRPKV